MIIAVVLAGLAPSLLQAASPSPAPLSSSATSPPATLPAKAADNASLNFRVSEAATLFSALQAGRDTAIPAWALSRAKGILIFSPGTTAVPGSAIGLQRRADGRFGFPAFYRPLLSDGLKPSGTSSLPAPRVGTPTVALLLSSRSLMVLAGVRPALHATADFQAAANVRTDMPGPRHDQLDMILYQPSAEVDVGALLATINITPDEAANRGFYGAAKPVTSAEVFAATRPLPPAGERLVATVNLAVPGAARVASTSGDDNTSSLPKEYFQRPADYFQPPDEYYQAPSEYFRAPDEYFQSPRKARD